MPSTVEDEGGERLAFVPVREMAADLSVHPRTLKRKARNDPDFPKLTIFGGCLHATKAGWEDYKRLLVTRGLEARPPKKFPIEHSWTSPVNRRARAAAK